MVKTYTFSKDNFTRTLIPRDEVLYLHTKVSRSNYKSDTIKERKTAYENVFYIPEGGYIRFPSFGLDVDKYSSTTILLLLSQYGKRERALTGDRKVARNVGIRRFDLSNSDNVSIPMLLMLSQYGKRERVLTGDHKVARNVELRRLDLSDSNNVVLFLNFMLDNPSNTRRLKSKRRVETRQLDASPPPSLPGR